MTRNIRRAWVEAEAAYCGQCGRCRPLLCWWPPGGRWPAAWSFLTERSERAESRSLDPFLGPSVDWWQKTQAKQSVFIFIYILGVQRVSVYLSGETIGMFGGANVPVPRLVGGSGLCAWLSELVSVPVSSALEGGLGFTVRTAGVWKRAFRVCKHSGAAALTLCVRAAGNQCSCPFCFEKCEEKDEIMTTSKTGHGKHFFTSQLSLLFFFLWPANSNEQQYFKTSEVMMET